jgi:PAS domain S-box-containing protein
VETNENEEQLLRSVALKTANSILLARQRAEQDLAHSLAMMRATLDSTTDGILVVDEKGQVTDFNEQFVRMWAVPRELLQSGERTPLLNLAAIQLKNPEQFLATTERIYETAPPESFDVLEFSDGRVFERFSKIQTVQDRHVGRVWSYRDVTAHRRAEEERERLLTSEKEARERAERETRMKDEFLATLSHELRTPLNAILGWANILRMTDRPQEIAEGLEVIERNARSQTQIIEDLLDMSRIVSGNVRLDVQRVDLVPVIKAAIESVKPMAAAKEMRVTSVLDPLAGPISGDPARLQQILWNLLTNALKFTRKGGRVHVVLERVDSHIEIGVTDSGEGITPDFLPHVFDRFRQADASTTRQQRGLGLGLAIVKNLAELHGGSVRAKSMGANQGSTFTVALPIATAKIDLEPGGTHPSAASGNDASDASPDLSGVRVLAVDDEADARQLIKRILTKRGALVETAGSSEDALKFLRQTKPDVLITDIGMPGEDGYAVIRKIRQLGAKDGGNIPAIALTAFARSEDRRRAILSGFQMHIAKPVEPSELVAMVASLANRTGDVSQVVD